MNTQPIIEVRSISKHYPLYSNKRDRMIEALDPFRRKRHTIHKALDGVSFTVQKGETLGIVGANGAGKSTLLKILTRILTPTAGECIVRGRVAALLELGAGFHPERTGRENIFFMGVLQGLTNEAVAELVPEIIQFADIGEYIDQPVRTYSSGMFVRLAFAVAIQGAPDILIVDEALTVGDEKFQRKCYTRMEKLKNDGCCILFVSHDVNAVIALCDRALLLSSGKILLQGTPKRVCDVYHELLYSNASSDGMIDVGEASPATLTEQGTTKDKPGPGDDYMESLDKRVSPIQYTSSNAKISNIRIEASDGRKVNRLVKGRTYYLRYDVNFLKNHSNVNFTASFKTISGLELFCPTLQRNNACAVTFQAITIPFMCLFTTGSYFVNVGVWPKFAEKPLHRIVDAMTFDVLPEKDSMVSGFIDLLRYADLD